MADDKKNTNPEPPVSESIASHAAWFRLVDQLNWYDRKSHHAQGWYKRLKIAQFTSAALIPATSLLPEYAKWAASGFGVLIAVLEAVQQMNQYSTLWFSYRATAERLKHEKYLFLSAAGPYKGLPEPERLVVLAERVEEHVSTEHANWFNETRRAATSQKPERA
ncbi:DUF4231 domain-containing protein [Mesorhizobium sp.]|uniref:DUF4231 domain-containing protein n=1 Tax=Mesorhizobium sp. TaxID=1871066 RepID=UPI000FE2A0EF|nr:DUF4231 domain-containing protein [Mesorhizobium sp.]RWK29341.1 MAG: DUF4231 domain-containing protein [Mesorhizobium sp.]RWM08154.1 MAG: DUF4231 domain-containing protein [Mesorhizobium sp.]TIP06260.1 MAG: DUF4231 domain-containing protein [Mesorhizobium sp.]TIP20176.1 MAG: DUF4231 domain-containing protein [Mesorhizobium sp.]TJV84449.1 MAG: DUF4231 domain-containing protein [Mesorhizobium sp.]